MDEPVTEPTPMLMPAAVGIRLGAGTLTLAVSRLGAGFEPLPSVVAGDRCAAVRGLALQRYRACWFSSACLANKTKHGSLE